MNEALILIDIQNMYFTDGACKLNEPEKAAEKAARVLAQFRGTHKPVIHVKHLFDVTGREDGEYLREINAAVTPLPGEIVISKRHPSAFLKTDLLSELKKLKIEQLVIVGMMTHMCIDTTTRAAQDYDLKVTLIHDACTTKQLEWNGITLDADIVHNSVMASLSGSFAKVVSCSEFLK